MDNIKFGEDIDFPIWMFGLRDMAANILKIKEDSATVAMSALRKSYHMICPDGNEVWFDYNALLAKMQELNTQEVNTGDVYKSGDKAGMYKTVKGELNGKLTGTVNAMEAKLSDKRYSFAIAEDSAAPSVHLFESAIDLLSYATLLKMKGRDWRQDAMLSLGGVFKQKQEFVIPMALSQYLQDHPGVHTLCLHLDNDEVGRDAAAGIMAGLGNRYEVLDRPPPSGKDVNDLLLQRRLGQAKRKEEWSR